MNDFLQLVREQQVPAQKKKKGLHPLEHFLGYFCSIY